MITFSILACLAAEPGPMIRVVGEGYIRLMHEGRVVFTREARLAVSNGKLGVEGNATFIPTLLYSGPLESLSIDESGTILAGKNVLGSLKLATFSTGALTQKEGFYVSSERATLVAPGQNGAGRLELGGSAVHTTSVTKAIVKSPTMQPTVVPTKTEPTKQTKREFTQPDLIALSRQDPPGLPTIPTNGVAIALWPRTFVDTERVTLGQVARIEGNPLLVKRVSAIPVTTMPPVGVETQLSVKRLEGFVEGAGIDHRLFRFAQTHGSVMQICQWVPDNEFVSSARSAVEQKFGTLGKIEPLQVQPAMAVPIGQFDLVAEQVTNSNYQYRVTVAVYVDHRLVNRRAVQLERRGLPDPMHIGESVQIRMISGMALIETTGVITRVGRLGEGVEVRTKDGAILSGTPIRTGWVEVKL